MTDYQIKQVYELIATSQSINKLSKALLSSQSKVNKVYSPVTGLYTSKPLSSYKHLIKKYSLELANISTYVDM